MIPEGLIEPDFEISTFPENVDYFLLKFGHLSGHKVPKNAGKINFQNPALSGPQES